MSLSLINVSLVCLSNIGKHILQILVLVDGDNNKILAYWKVETILSKKQGMFGENNCSGEL